LITRQIEIAPLTCDNEYIEGYMLLSSPRQDELESQYNPYPLLLLLLEGIGFHIGEARLGELANELMHQDKAY
jgi:hypothetical protein